MFDLNLHCYRLLMEEPFFAALSRQLDKRPNSSIPTAGVGVDPSGKFVLHYNPEYMEGMSDTRKKGILKHEFYHLVFEHVTGRLPSDGLTPEWNVAADLAINGLIPREQLPEGDGCCYPGEGRYSELQSGMSAEWYYPRVKEIHKEERAKRKAQQQGGQGQGEGGQGQPGEGDPGHTGSESGDHSHWQPEGAGDSALSDVAKERLRKAMKKAVEEANSSNNGWGSVPQQVRESIIDAIKVKVDFKKVLRYFVKTSQRANKKTTIKRINKRYPYIHAGRKTERRANLAIAIDQSGSVDDGMLELFFGALNDLATLATFTIVPFDTEVCEDNVEVWKKGEKKKGRRVRYGGTCFDAPTRWVNERSGDFDGLIILTDMEASKPVACKVPRLWGTDTRGAERPYFQTNERIMVIEK